MCVSVVLTSHLKPFRFPTPLLLPQGHRAPPHVRMQLRPMRPSPNLPIQYRTYRMLMERVLKFRSFLVRKKMEPASGLLALPLFWSTGAKRSAIVFADPLILSRAAFVVCSPPPTHPLFLGRLWSLHTLADSISNLNFQHTRS